MHHHDHEPRTTIYLNPPPLTHRPHPAVPIHPPRYDFACFGALADVIGENFFPGHDNTTKLLEALGVFGAAFLMRPLGGLLVGRIGDSIGKGQI